jgi:O-acetyl-ADP-ribose deacetylase (regulator of RNase III)
LQNSGEVCNAIFTAAGITDLQKACEKNGNCKTGSAVATSGFALTKYIIHTVGPIWKGGNNNERNTLYACYRNSLVLAKKLKCKSIAVPLISTDKKNYPKEKSLRVAIKAIGDFLLENDLAVTLVLIDNTKYELRIKLRKPLQKYLNNNYIEKQHGRISKTDFETLRSISLKQIQATSPTDIKGVLNYFNYTQKASFSKDSKDRYSPTEKQLNELNDLEAHLSESFSHMLFRIIDEKDLSDPEVYRKANITRSVFSAIRTKANHQPSKNTVICLAIALELSYDTSQDLLARAGFTLSPSSMHDMIVAYYIKEKKYNIFELNETLYYYGQSLLGTKL